MLESVHGKANAGHPQERSAAEARHPAALAHLRQKQIDHQYAQTHRHERHNAVDKVCKMCDGQRSGALRYCDLVLLMLILDCTVILVTPTRLPPSHTEV